MFFYVSMSSFPLTFYWNLWLWWPTNMANPVSNWIQKSMSDITDTKPLFLLQSMMSFHFSKRAWQSCWPLAGCRLCLLMWWSHICGITEHAGNWISMAIFLQWCQISLKWILKTTQLGVVSTGPHYSRQESTEKNLLCAWHIDTLLHKL